MFYIFFTINVALRKKALTAYASRECSDEPAETHSLARAFPACNYKEWSKMDVQISSIAYACYVPKSFGTCRCYMCGEGQIIQDAHGPYCTLAVNPHKPRFLIVREMQTVTPQNAVSDQGLHCLLTE